jgi:two-component system sensor histidine kinase QseC
MTLRLRLMLMIGCSMLLLWGGVALWMLHDLDQEMERTLDQRLTMSAHMVAELMSQNPAAWDGRPSNAGASTLAMPNAVKGIACKVSLRGAVIARTPDAATASFASDAFGFGDLIINGVHWRSYTVEAHGLRVTTADRLTERETLLRNVTMATVAPFAVALVGSLIVLWFGAGSGLRPLERLRQMLASRTPDDLAPINTVALSPDLLPLVATLNHLLGRMTVTLERERRFTSDAAHELRTPLTAIKTHLQVARITDGEDAVLAMDYAQEGVARLEHTLSQLLTLSQVEGAFTWHDERPAQAGAVARLALRDAAPGNSGGIAFDGGNDTAALGLPEALAATALRNLLENALRHSPADNSVKLAMDETAQTIRFTVSDRGQGLSDAELGLATQRFWRRRSGRGSGLGLSIVVAIAERFGGSLVLLQRPGGGLQAVLTLPKNGWSDIDQTTLWAGSKVRFAE